MSCLSLSQEPQNFSHSLFSSCIPSFRDGRCPSTVSRTAPPFSSYFLKIINTYSLSVSRTTYDLTQYLSMSISKSPQMLLSPSIYSNELVLTCTTYLNRPISLCRHYTSHLLKVRKFLIFGNHTYTI